LKNISQNGNLPQVGVKIKNISNHHPEMDWPKDLAPQVTFFTNSPPFPPGK